MRLALHSATEKRSNLLTDSDREASPRAPRRIAAGLLLWRPALSFRAPQRLRFRRVDEQGIHALDDLLAQLNGRIPFRRRRPDGAMMGNENRKDHPVASIIGGLQLSSNFGVRSAGRVAFPAGKT